MAGSGDKTTKGKGRGKGRGRGKGKGKGKGGKGKAKGKGKGDGEADSKVKPKAAAKKAAAKKAAAKPKTKNEQNTAELEKIEAEVEVKDPSVTTPEDEATPQQETPAKDCKGKGKKRPSSKAGATPDEASGSTQKSLEPPNKRVKNTAKQQETNSELTGEDGKTPPENKVRKEPATFARRAVPVSEFGKLKWNAIKSAFNEIIKPHLVHYSVEEDTHTSQSNCQRDWKKAYKKHQQPILLTKLPLALVTLGVYFVGVYF